MDCSITFIMLQLYMRSVDGMSGFMKADFCYK